MPGRLFGQARNGTCPHERRGRLRRHGLPAAIGGDFGRTHRRGRAILIVVLTVHIQIQVDPRQVDVH
jgi:hypothetical protein